MSATSLFVRRFRFEPQVTAQASGRVNLLGEHTDYNDGFVLPTALGLRTEVAVARSRDDRFRFTSENLSGDDATVEYRAGETPPAGFGRYVQGCIEVLRERGAEIPPIVVAVHSNLPMGAGLSSSAALEIAVLRALRELFGLDIDDVTMARLGQRAEIEFAGVRCGILDQMAVSVGQPGQLLFLDTRSLEARLVPFPASSDIAIFDSGVPRTLAASGYNERRQECETAARMLGVASLRDATDAAAIEALPEPWRRRARHVLTENRRVLDAASGVDAEQFGRLMLESHRSLRDDYEVSVPALDALVETLVEQGGVHGCKLTGAGFGGAVVALVDPDFGPGPKAAALAAFAAKGYRGSLLL
ncbi:MAG TPA: galactokinase [Steroidobacteraceae bacterium]|nr:galactokinase [Steroidobacteraceae bacterium]